jgi:membrane dipeptidase
MRHLLSLIAVPLIAQPNLHRDAFVMDGHVHMINRQHYLGGDIGERYRDGQVDLPRIRDVGIDAILFSLISSEQ